MDQRVIKGQETKNKILNAALILISEEGTKKLSAKKVADLAGVSKSNIFHHFTSVESLLEELLDSLCARATDTIDLSHCHNTMDFLMKLGDSTFNLPDSELAIYKALFMFYQDALFHNQYKEKLIQIKLGMIRYIQEGIKKLDNTNVSESIAELIASDLDGLGLNYLVEGNSEKYLHLWKIKCKLYDSYFKNCK